MKKNRIDRDIVTVLVCSLITLTAWVGFEVYRVFLSNKKELDQIEQVQIRELNPVLKVEVLDELERRQP